MCPLMQPRYTRIEYKAIFSNSLLVSVRTEMMSNGTSQVRRFCDSGNNVGRKAERLTSLRGILIDTSHDDAC